MWEFCKIVGHLWYEAVFCVPLWAYRLARLEMELAREAEEARRYRTEQQPGFDPDEWTRLRAETTGRHAYWN